MAYKPALWALNCMKGVLREFLPPHIRFVRSGSRFLATVSRRSTSCHGSSSRARSTSTSGPASAATHSRSAGPSARRDTFSASSPWRTSPASCGPRQIGSASR